MQTMQFLFLYRMCGINASAVCHKVDFTIENKFDRLLHYYRILEIIAVDYTLLQTITSP